MSRAFYTHSEQETEALGERLGQQVRPGMILAYEGDLGAGKTVFTRGLARGLGITDRITSPTYTIVNEYAGDIPLFHFDLYRISCPEELLDIGWEDYLDRGGVLAVEWSSRAAGLLDDALRIVIEKDPDRPEVRKITMEGGGRFADFSL